MYLTQLRIERKAGVSLSNFRQYDKVHRETTEGENKSHATFPLFLGFRFRHSSTVGMRNQSKVLRHFPLKGWIWHNILKEKLHRK